MTVAAGAISHRQIVMGAPFSPGMKKNAAKKSSSIIEHRCQDT
jgi:hypothetical protein